MSSNPESDNQLVSAKSSVRAQVLSFCLLALILLAPIPFGSAALWTHAVIVTACAVIFLAGRGISTDSQQSRFPWLIGTLLAAWTVVQFIPLPVSLLAKLHPASAETYAALLPADAQVPLCMNRFVALSTIAYWIGVSALVYMTTKLFSSKSSALLLVKCVIVSGFLQGLFGVLARGTSFWGSNPFVGRRAIGTFSGGASFGGYLLITLPLTAGLLLYTICRFSEKRPAATNRFRSLRTMGLGIPSVLLMLAVATVVQMAALILSGSRSCMAIGAITGMLICVWFLRRGSIVVRGRVFAVGLVILLLFALIGVGGGYALAKERFGRLIEDPYSVSLRSRLLVWKGAIETIWRYPLGIGPGCFLEIGAGIRHVGLGERRLFLAHSDYLQTFCELGIPGGLLLLCLAVHLVRRAGRAALRVDDDASRWIYRGIGLSLLAALLQALVDFNLSSRPGVALTFFALLGILLADDARHQAAGKKKGNERHTGAGRAVSSVLLCLTVMVSVRAGIASLLIENGKAALGGTADSYLWLAASDEDIEKGTSLLELGQKIAPDWGRVNHLRGLGRAMAFAARREETTASAIEDGLPEALAIALVQGAMRAEQVAAFSEAMPDFERAVRLCPWNPDFRASLARAVAEVSLAQTEKTALQAELGAVLTHADTALLLAPDDWTALNRICAALAVGLESSGFGNELAPQFKKRLVDSAAHALKLARGQREQLLATLFNSPLEPAELLDGTHLPPPIVWKVYDYHNSLAHFDTALKLLEYLKTSCDDPEAVYYRDSDERKDNDRKTYRGLHIREQARWLLRRGLWDDYRKMQPERFAAFKRMVDERLAVLESVDGVSPVVMRLKLRNVGEDIGLDAERTVRLCRLEYECGSMRAASDLLSEIALSKGGVTISLLREFVKDPLVEESRDTGSALARARILFEDKQYEEAVGLYRDILDSEQLPLSYEGRTRLMMLKCLEALDVITEAYGVAEEGFKSSGRDPELIRKFLTLHEQMSVISGSLALRDEAIALLAEYDSMSRIDMKFCGGRAELMGIKFVPVVDILQSSAYLKTYWRFEGAVPSDLESVVTVKDVNGVITYGRSKPMREARDLIFMAGMPPLGAIITVDYPMPPLFADPSMAVTIGLRRESTGEWMSSTENLRFMECRAPEFLEQAGFAEFAAETSSTNTAVITTP